MVLLGSNHLTEREGKAKSRAKLPSPLDHFALRAFVSKWNIRQTSRLVTHWKTNPRPARHCCCFTTLSSQYITHEHSHITHSVAAMDSSGDVDELPSPCLASLDTVTTVSSSYSSNKGLSSLREKGTDQARSIVLSERLTEILITPIYISLFSHLLMRWP